MPSVVVNVTAVPLCGGVPADSSTCAVITAVPLAGSAVAPATSVIVEPVGASSGTFSQAAKASARATQTSASDIVME